MPSNDLNVRWGRRLAEAREALDLSIRELARRTGLHHGHLARFEQGEVGLGDEARIRVAAEIGQQVHTLFPYPPIGQESPCPPAVRAQGAASSPTPETTAAPRSNAPSAAEQAAREREAS